MSEKCVMCSWDGDELYAMCALHQEIFDQRQEIERLTRDLGEARTAAKWLYAWVDESMWTHFDNEDVEVLRKWPWLWGGCE